MEITEIRIKLMEEPGERLLAFCSITFDNSFVVRDLKIIDGINGPFVAMPSRKLTVRCPTCRCKNYLRASYCNQCGHRLDEIPIHDIRDETGRAKLYADVAHPINTACREMIQNRVIQAYNDELEKSKMPGYVSSYSDFTDSGEEGNADYTANQASGNNPHQNSDDSRRAKTAPPQEGNSFGKGVF
ncbi:MAG: SpoVG family protein [Planctomycetaceae bacterium]|jgi:stage V sporulation protein G|nr:SpoVG family protein [Planctomycetaceae bacterium]